MFIEVDGLNDEEVYLKLIRTHDDDFKKQWSASYVFKIKVYNELKSVGECDLRITHYDSTYIAGNIGYNIYPKYQKKGYATKAVKLLIKQAIKHKMEYVIITCDPTNVASSKVALKAGFTFIERTTIPRDHQMYLEGKREVLIYKKIL